MTIIKLDLTDEEWMSVINQNRDGLPYCCGNVSALRDCIIGMARNGECGPFDVRQFLMTYQWVVTGHDFESKVITKIHTQIIEGDPQNKDMWDAILELNEHQKRKEF